MLFTRNNGLIVVILFFCHQAAAAITEEVFISASRVEENTSSHAGNGYVVDSKTLKLLSHTHIQESLVRVPGVDMHRNNGQEYLPAIRSPVLSGAGACGSFLMAEDNIPLRPAGFCNVNELFEAHAEQAERIEVLRGPGNALYGSNAIHGVINVIGSAQFDSDLQAGIEAGPNDYGQVKLSKGWDDFAFSLTSQHDGGYRDASGLDQQKLSLRHRHENGKIKTTTGFTAVNLNQETAGFIVGKDAYKNSSLAKTNPNPEAYRDASALRLWTRIESVKTNGAQWVLTPYIRYSEMAFLQHFLPGTPTEENGQSSLGFQSAWFLGSERNRVIMGVDAEYARGWLKQTQASPTQGSAFLQATIPAGKHYDYEVDALQLSPFILWDKWLGRDWKFNVGLRFESMQYDYDNRMLVGRTRDDGVACGFGGCRYSRPADGTDRFNNWSPNVGLLYQLNNRHQLFTNVVHGFRAPQTTELYRLQRAQKIVDLDPEELTSVEVGLRGSARENTLNYEVIAYSMRKRNIIYRDTSFFNVSNGETKHVGVELGLSYQFAPAWDLAASATVARHHYQNHQLINNIDIHGNTVDTAPHHFGSIQLGWAVAERSRIEMEWQRMGAYYTDPENQHRYDGHDVFNLRAYWQVKPQLRLSAKLLNTFDAEYANRADYSKFSGDRYFPGRERTLYLGIQHSFK